MAPLSPPGRSETHVLKVEPCATRRKAARHMRTCLRPWAGHAPVRAEPFEALELELGALSAE